MFVNGDIDPWHALSRTLCFNSSRFLFYFFTLHVFNLALLTFIFLFCLIFSLSIVLIFERRFTSIGILPDVGSTRPAILIAGGRYFITAYHVMSSSNFGSIQ